MTVSVPRPFLSLFFLLSSLPALLSQFPRHFNPNHRSAFALGVENGLNSFPFGHHFSEESFPVRPLAKAAPPPFAFSAVGPPNFNSFAFRGGFFSPFVGASFASPYAPNTFLRESIFDRDNFQARGCGWEMSRANCVDLFGICKGGCEDFSLGDALFHDCRCVPIGYSALLMGR